MIACVLYSEGLVSVWNKALCRSQILEGILADGDFDLEMEIAVREFQRANHLSIDGIVGARMYAALRREADGR